MARPLSRYPYVEACQVKKQKAADARAELLEKFPDAIFELPDEMNDDHESADSSVAGSMEGPN